MTMEKFIGKVVATRGLTSGVNVGVCVAIKDTNTLLAPGSFFCRAWDYKKSHGAFHSLSEADVTGGTITYVKGDTVITDTAQLVVCDDKLMDILKKLAK